MRIRLTFLYSKNAALATVKTESLCAGTDPLTESTLRLCNSPIHRKFARRIPYLVSKCPINCLQRTPKRKIITLRFPPLSSRASERP